MVLSGWQRPTGIELIGCGGTGARLAELLCRLIIGFGMPALKLRLWDGDTVDEANIARQNFEPCEIGFNKAQAMALRLSGRFGIPIDAVARSLTAEEMKKERTARHRDKRARLGRVFSDRLVITCTDNLESRRLVARLHEGWWLDVGNGLSAGQAVLGCVHDPAALKRVAGRWGEELIRGDETDPALRGLAGLTQVRVLPDLAGVDPSLMRSRKKDILPSCAAMPFSVQGFGVNELAALAAAALAKQLLVDGCLSYGAIFFDAAAGRMAPRPLTQDWFELHTPGNKGKKL
jgi:PRTRC genetic system ThiF family protein